MRLRSWLTLAALVATPLVVARDAAARPPAYTMHAGFSTALRNVENAREECFDAEPAARPCKERGAITVAEGETSHSAVKTQVRIREHRGRPSATARDLEALAKRVMSRAALGRELRSLSGTAAGQATLEHWALWDACARKIAGRVFVALPDKIVEIEAIAAVEPNEASVADAVAQVKRILHGARVRRVGDVALDAGAAPAVAAVSEAVTPGC